jgi:hypothetical protein
MSQNIQNISNDLQELQEQALRCVNDATFTLNNLRSKFLIYIYFFINFIF